MGACLVLGDSSVVLAYPVPEKLRRPQASPGLSPTPLSLERGLQDAAFGMGSQR